VISTNISQGSLTVVGGANLIGNLGALNVGASATVTVVMSPGTVAGVLTSTATVSALSGEIDLAPVNNSVSLSTTLNLPVADLAVSQTASPNPATVTSNVTYAITVTNRGPGIAFNVRLTDVLPGFINTTVNLGNLPAHASTNLFFTVTPMLVQSITNSATVSTDSTDTNAANNSVSSTVLITALAARLVAGDAALKSESGPINGEIDPGERVTVSLTLTNAGSASTTPAFTATLLLGGGVTAPSGSVIYGAMAPGQNAARSFSFTAVGVNGGVITATLQLQDGANNLGTVGFTLVMSATTTYSNTNAITIPDHGTASPYPSAIVVSGVTGVVSKATVTLSGLTHSFVSDVSALLVSPAGTSVLLMSHVTSGLPVTNLTLTFDDLATGMLTNNGPISSGVSRPSAYGSIALPGLAAPYGSTLSALNWASPNGIWSLYVFDDSTGDGGVISSGWSLNLVTGTTLSSLVDLAVGVSSTPGAVFAGSAITNTISVTNLGPVTATGVYVTQPLPPGASFLPQYSQGALNGGQVTASVGNLAVGGTAKVTIVLVPFLGGVMTNSASVAANEEDLNPANSSAQALATVYTPLPTILTGVSQNGLFQVTGTGQGGLNYIFLASTNLSSWVPVSTNVAAPDNTISFISTNSVPYEFFRTRLWTP
jgi:uncharacterized repeat protein (TIGR01451 family)